MRTPMERKRVIARGIIITVVAGLAGSAVMADGPRHERHGMAGKAESHNMRLVGHDDLQARSAYWPAIQQQGHRWIAYVGHHGGVRLNPQNNEMEQNGVSIVDVTDPKHPVYLKHLPATGFRPYGAVAEPGDPPPNANSGAQMIQTCLGADLPVHDRKVYMLRSNGNISHEVWDVTDPSNPDFVVEALGEAGADATHKNWWDCETGIAYLTYDGRQRLWRNNRVLFVVDLSDPESPRVIRTFGLVGQEPGSAVPVDEVPPGQHEAALSPDGTRLYPAYGTGSDGVVQIVDVQKLLECDTSMGGCPGGGDDFPMSMPEPTPEDLLYPQVGRFDMPSFWGGHTAFPLIGMDVPELAGFEEGTPRNFLAVVSESTSNECTEPTQHPVFMVDMTDEAHPMPVANYQVDESRGDFCSRGGRFGAHSSNWSYNPDFYNKLIVASWFNAGVRAIDIRDPYRPKEVGYFIPRITANTDERDGKFAIQTNNVEIDNRGYIYLADRADTGLHIVKLTGDAKKIVQHRRAHR